MSNKNLILRLQQVLKATQMDNPVANTNEIVNKMYSFENLDSILNTLEVDKTTLEDKIRLHQL